MTGAGGRPRSFAELQRSLDRKLVALERRQIPRSATVDAVVAVTSLSTSGVTVGADGVSFQRVNGFTHARGHVLRTAGETGLLFVLPDGLRPSSVEWTIGQQAGSPAVQVKFFPNGDVRIQYSVLNGDFVFAHSFPAVPVVP